MFEDDALADVGVDEALLSWWLELPAGQCPVGLSAGARVDVLVLLERQKRWLEAAQLRVLAAIGAADGSELGLAQEVVSVALRVPPRTAQPRLVTAVSLVGQLPVTVGLLDAGVISGRQAEVITEASWALDPRLVGAFEQLVCPWAGEQTTGQTARAARRAVLRLDPAGAQARHEQAVAGRRVSCRAVDARAIGAAGSSTRATGLQPAHRRDRAATSR